MIIIAWWLSTWESLLGQKNKTKHDNHKQTAENFLVGHHCQMDNGIRLVELFFFIFAEILFSRDDHHH